MPAPYTKEQIKEANSVNLIDYAAMNGYELENGGQKSLHAKKSGGLYLFKDSNRFYHHTTEKTGGPIDFIMEFENKSFVEAVGHLIGVQPDVGTYTRPEFPEPKEKGEMTLPDKADNVRRIYWYLCTARGIDSEIVSKLIKDKKLYQQADRGNCVFVGYDENQTAKYCAKRGTSPEKPYKGDQDNSDKGYPFSMEGTSNRLYVMESPIDVMSHASLSKMLNVDSMQDHRISLGSLSDKALEWYLKQHPEIKQIVFALDNDTDGKAPDGTHRNHGQEAANKFAAKYAELGYDVAIQTPTAKDFNEDLMTFRDKKQEFVHAVAQKTETEQEDEDELEQ